MSESISFVTLKCLNCGAKLQINDNIFEFACQYCGTSQIVERFGGIVTLKFLSDKIERVENRVNETYAEVKIQRLKRELEELEERFLRLDESAIKMKEMVKNVTLIVCGITVLSFFILMAYTGSIIFVLLGLAVIGIVFWVNRIKINSIDSDFKKASKPIVNNGLEIKKQIAELQTEIK